MPVYFEPFDRTFALVIDRINLASQEFPADARAWIGAVVAGFQFERDRWEDNKFGDYRMEWQRLRPKILQLAAASYLHVSYDVPRVLANEWPETLRWPRLPVHNASAYFFLLDREFLDIFMTAAGDRRIAGWPAYLLGRSPRWAFRIGNQWLLLLRRAAWPHAQQLIHSPDRNYLEQKMLFAVTAALKDVNGRAWRLGLLSPPDHAFVPAILPVTFSDFDKFWAGATAVAALAVLLALMDRLNGYRYDEMTQYIDKLGSRTLEYVSAAVANPEGFDQYRSSRLQQSPNLSDRSRSI